MGASVDPRRWLVFRARGLSRYLVLIDSSVEDLEGAFESGQRELAAERVRSVVLKYLSVIGLQTIGSVIEAFDLDEANFDPLLGVSVDLAREKMKLVDLTLNAVNSVDQQKVKSEVAVLLGELRRLLGLNHSKNLRSRDGAMLMVRFVKDWEGHLTRMGLPSALPSEWTNSETSSPS
jgi:hypothetical protein